MLPQRMTREQNARYAKLVHMLRLDLESARNATVEKQLLILKQEQHL